MTDELPPGWRPEWKRKEARTLVARARAELPALPSEPSELADVARRVLVDVAENGGGADASARVGAAKVLLDDAKERMGAKLGGTADSSELMAALLEARGWKVEKPPEGA